ncbi:hypothetical protein ABZ770_19435 [Streptomyces sp. NPDC006654]|uniref:hypothetical protein n=1 Tax=unclassified Streptomyces TaxID=2593676 RepID=UPI0033D247B1
MPQQRRTRPGRPAAVPLSARLARGAAVAGSLALLPLTAACGGGGDEGAEGEPSAGASTVSAQQAGVVAPAKVEVIAGLTGCTATIRVQAEELREGSCHTAAGDYLITTFPEDRLLEVWLDSAGSYRGTYLVGTRWVVSGRPETLKAFRPKLGGDIVRLTGPAGPSVP